MNDVSALKKAPARDNREALLSAPILPTLLRLSAPNAVAMSALALAAIAETAYVGALGVEPLAAMALVFPMIMLMQMMSAGAMGGGVSSAIARALGAGDRHRANTLAMHAIVIGIALGLLFTAFFWLFGEAIYGLLGGRGGALREAIVYSNTAFSGAVAIWLFNTLASILRGTGDMKVPSVLGLLVAGAQIGIGGTLGLGLGPVPRLGMIGVGLGQVIAFGFGTLYLFWYLRTGRARLRLTLEGFRAQRVLFLDILKVGALSCVSPLQTVLTILIFTGLVAQFGTTALAGYGIGARLEFLLIPVAFSIGVASVPMVGMAVGAKNIARARRVAWTAAYLAASALAVIGGIVVAVPDAWSRLFTTDEAVIATARQYLIAAGAGFPFFGFGLCLYFASQGSGKVLGPVVAGTIRLVMVAIGGWWLTASAADAWTLFVLAGAAMAVYGLSTGVLVRATPWDALVRVNPGSGAGR